MATKEGTGVYKSKHAPNRKNSRSHGYIINKNIKKIVNDLCDNKIYCSENEREELREIPLIDGVFRLKVLGAKYLNTNPMLAYDIFSKLGYEQGRTKAREKLINPDKKLSEEELATNHAWAYFALTEDKDLEGLKSLVTAAEKSQNETIAELAQMSLDEIMQN
jgi:hypothetical protein